MEFGINMYCKETQQRTIDVFDNFEVSSLSELPIICMKNYDGRFGIIRRTDIISKTYIITSNTQLKHYRYDSIQHMINDGWVID